MLKPYRNIQCFTFLIFTALMMVPAMLKAETKPKKELLVAAAASLKDVLEEIAPHFEREFPDIRLNFQFAASGTLQQQIDQGAPVDVYISAATRHMDALLHKDRLLAKTVHTLLSNELVLIVPKGKPVPRTLDDLKKPEFRRIALGEGRTVPAGEYAEAWLHKGALREAIQHKLIPAVNVRQVLSFVETGNVDAGFVFTSDALSSSKVQIALRAAADRHPPIRYPVAVVKKSKQPEQALAFIQFLQSEKVRDIFRVRGFRV